MAWSKNMLSITTSTARWEGSTPPIPQYVPMIVPFAMRMEPLGVNPPRCRVITQIGSELEIECPAKSMTTDMFPLTVMALPDETEKSRVSTYDPDSLMVIG